MVEPLSAWRATDGKIHYNEYDAVLSDIIHYTGNIGIANQLINQAEALIPLLSRIVVLEKPNGNNSTNA